MHRGQLQMGWLIDDAGALANKFAGRRDVMTADQAVLHDLVATNFIVYHCTISAMASTSRKSFFCALE
jgi:hypothetical protein